MEQEPIKTEKIRNSDGTFAPGTAPGPGRPPGQTLKEYWRKRFQQMTEEEKMEFTAKVGNDVIWKMAEGNPKNDIEHSGTLNIGQVLDDIEHGSTTEEQTVENEQPLQNQEQTKDPDNVQAEQSSSSLQPEQVVEKYNP